MNVLSYHKTTTCHVFLKYYGVSSQKKQILFATSVGAAITPIFLSACRT